MNTHDKYELPAEFRSGNNIPVERATITRERMLEILQAAIEADRKRMGESDENAPPKLSDSEIESLACGFGMRWNGDYWICEDADLHPMVRGLLYRYTEAPQPAEPAKKKELLFKG